MYTSAFDGARRLRDSEHSTEMKLFCGSCRSEDGHPVVGRLLFSSQASSCDTSDATIRVTDRRTDMENAREPAAAWIVLGEHTMTEACTSLFCPVLFLSELSENCHGKIALLDPTLGLLFVSPNLATLNRYSERLRTPPVKENPAPIFLPSGKRLRFCTVFPDNAVSAEGALLKLPLGGSEDELYDRYRDAAEWMPGLPITAVLELSQKDDLLYAQIRALFRSAVYGSFSCLVQGILTDSDRRRFLACAHRCFCDLEAEGREFNGYIKKGMLLDTPLLSKSSVCADGLDFLCVDAGKLTDRLTGGRERTDDAFLSILEETFTEQFAQLRGLSLSMILDNSPTVKALLPRLLQWGVSELFISGDLLPWMRRTISSLSSNRIF